MKTVVLKWVPSESEYTREQFEQDMFNINEGHTIPVIWPVSENSGLAEGDRLFMLRDDGGEQYLCASGYFSSDPYENADDGRLIIDLDLLNIVNPDNMDDAIVVSQVAKAVPSVDWENVPDGYALCDGEVACIEELWLDFVVAHRDAFDGIRMAKSWIFELEKFETIPDLLQQRFMKKYGCRCEKCGATADKCQELAYHVVVSDKQPYSLRNNIVCLCDECWFK